MKKSVPRELLEVQKRVEERLFAFFQEKRKTSKQELRLVQTMEEFCLRGGKRLRAYLVVLGYEIAGQKSDEKIYDIACALELLHAAILIHDDVIDDDKKRRGKPSLHVMYAKELGSHDSGISRALAVGNILSSWAIEFIYHSAFSAQAKVAAARILHPTAVSTGIGEAMDIVYSFSNNLKPEQSLRIAKLKTAKYSMEGPLLVGYILGGGKKHAAELAKIAEGFGTAFQIQDDALGLFGNKFNDNEGSDIREGKPLYLVSKALHVESLKKNIQRLFLEQAASSRSIEDIRALLKKSPLKKETEQLTHQYVEESKKHVTKLKLPEPTQTKLLQVIDYVTSREE